MKRKEALATIFGVISSEDVTVSTTGLISREVYSCFHSQRNIYVPGSMGLVSSIGLGIALAVPRQRVVVIDGDASLLMNLSSLVSIGHHQPKNLLHIVLDNQAYGSCSEEASMSSSAKFEQLATVVGYQDAWCTRSERELKDALSSFTQGPRFIRVMIQLGGRRDFARPLDLVRIKQEFMGFLNLSNQRRIL